MRKDKTILVVEDEQPLINAIKKKLETGGYDVVTARSYEQAIEYLNTIDSISCIWLDHYLLGTESGLDLVVDLKKDDSKWKNLPVYVVSNTAGPDKVQAYLRLGVNKYFTKADYRLDEIVGEIDKAIE